MMAEVVKRTHIYNQNWIETNLNIQYEYAQLVEYQEMNQEAVGIV